MSYHRLDGEGEDDFVRRPMYNTQRNSSNNSFFPAATQFLDSRDRLAAQPTFSVENLFYSYGLHESYQSGRSQNEQPFHRPYRATHNVQPNFNEFIPSYKNNYVADCPVPSKLFNQLLPEMQCSNEFTHMRYTAVTGDPTEFCGRRFDLRQHLYGVPRQVELFIVVTMYNETQDLLARTLIGIFQNINYMESSDEPGWGRGSWRKIVVCIVSDGVEKINAGSRALLAGLGVYQEVYQGGLPIEKVNGETVAAHLYEYTTQMKPQLESDNIVSVKPGNTPVQLLFCLKQENKQKINSHRWFFQAFGTYLQPNVCVLLDAGTKPGENSIYLLWNTFHRNPNCAGACGEIKADIGRLGKSLFNPLVATQNFEYKISNILDKPLESAFGFISVLPGAFSAYRFKALQGRPLEMYFAGEEMHDKSDFFTANMYLAEDRILCYELVTKRHSKWVLRFVKGSTGETDVPDGICEFISQRRRWLNGSFFAAVYTIWHFGRIWRSKHTFLRKILLTVEILYQLVSMLFSWFALANFFLVFRILTRSCADPALLGKPGMIVAVLFEWFYLVALIACFFLALGHTTKGAHKIYLVMVSFWALVMAYLMFASIFVAIKSLQAQFHKGFRLRDLLANHVFATLILSMVSTYALWIFVSFLFLDPWHMFTSFIQYLLMTPTYINVLNVYAFCNTHDLSWGTKGDTATPTHDMKKTEDGKFRKPSPKTHPDVQYDKELAKIGKAVPEDKELTPSEQEKKNKEDKKAYYATVRSGIVMAWVTSNLALATVVLETSSLSSLINSTIPREQRQAQTAGIYLTIVLWSVAALAGFRFIGSMWFLIHRLRNNV